ncbi:glycerophosphodiester phosphodiesterase [Enterocloster lavalensis]|uniref:glycerophosphodiester phosphodiesterase n=1 Tax=Enterocloster lavalensis TaxID=460384 RepID=UPI0023F01ACE|nr:glycerophosphodiester phosphodiesterase [Enterocloster lavalensis]
MKTFFRETYQVLRVNLRQLVLFEILYRLVAGAFYIRLVNLLLKISLRAAGYSYLTMSNLAAFLLRPVTVGCAMVLVLVGAFLLVVELGGLMTAYQAAAYSRRIDVVSIVRGAVGKAVDELSKRNWQLFLLALASYLMMNSMVLLRLLTRVKPVNFVMAEIWSQRAGRAGLAAVVAGLVVIGIPTMLVFFACMVEQKRFRDGVRRSMELVKGRWPKALALLFGLNALMVAASVALHLLFVVAAAVCVTLFVDSYAAMAVLAAVCRRLELVVLAVASMAAGLVDFGALTVVYYQFETRRSQVKPWDFSYVCRDHLSRKRILAVTGAVAGVSLLFLLDMVCNGFPLDSSVLTETEITAHRGSSKRAPENTLAALETAIDEMADYAEIDVQTTSDGVVVVCHDLNLKRLAGVNRRLGSMTYGEVRDLDVGSRFGADFAGERIPTLEEALDDCKGRIKLNIELKNIGDRTDLPEQVVEMIRDREMQEQCVVTSVKLDYLVRVKEADPDLHTGYILPAAYGRYYDNDAFDFISLRSSFVTLGLVENAHEKGKAVHVWTVNKKSEIEQMKVLGVDNIITDYPALAREVLYREEATESLMEYLKMVLR